LLVIYSAPGAFLVQLSCFRNFSVFGEQIANCIRIYIHSHLTQKIMAYAFIFPIRVAQAFLALLILILDAYVVHNWSWAAWSPSEANFILFCAVWTLLAVAYLVFAPMHAPVAAHKFGILAAEVLTTIFWFAGWIALAVLLGDIPGCGHWNTCRVAAAADVFSAIEWLLFMATMFMSAIHVWRTRDDRSGKHDPHMHAHPAV
jgi:hypothetical protein